jgi:hypothetical protein
MENYFQTRPLQVAAFFLKIVWPPVLAVLTIAELLGYTPGWYCGKTPLRYLEF